MGSKSLIDYKTLTTTSPWGHINALTLSPCSSLLSRWNSLLFLVIELAIIRPSSSETRWEDLNPSILLLSFPFLILPSLARFFFLFLVLTPPPYIARPSIELFWSSCGHMMEPWLSSILLFLVIFFSFLFHQLVIAIGWSTLPATNPPIALTFSSSSFYRDDMRSPPSILSLKKRRFTIFYLLDEVPRVSHFVSLVDPQ